MKTMYKYYFSTSHLLCINHIHNIQLTNKMQYNFYYVFYSLISLQQVSAAIFRGTLLHLNLFILVIISPWRWQQQRPKHVAESLVNKIHHKHWRTFCWIFLYIIVKILVWSNQRLRGFNIKTIFVHCVTECFVFRIIVSFRMISPGSKHVAF